MCGVCVCVCVCACEIERERERERQRKWHVQRVLPPAGQYIKSFNTKSICKISAGVKPPQSALSLSLSLALSLSLSHMHRCSLNPCDAPRTSLTLFSTGIEICVCDLMTQESGGHTAKHSAFNTPLLPLDTGLVTKPTHVLYCPISNRSVLKNKRYLGSRLSVLQAQVK